MWLSSSLSLIVIYSVSSLTRLVFLISSLLLCALFTPQLEAREGAGLVSGGVQSAAGPGFVESQHSETPSLHRERDEQQRLLADTRLTAMDLRCRLEHNERDWLREKAELLERFNVERREWETQLRDMQRKIEEVRISEQMNMIGFVCK